MTWLSNGIALRKAAQVLGASSSSRRAWKMKSPAWMINWLIDWSRDRWGLEDIHCSPGHPRQGRFQPAPDACGTARVIGSECRLDALAKHSDRCNRLRCGFFGASDGLPHRLLDGGRTRRSRFCCDGWDRQCGDRYSRNGRA